MLCFGAVLAAPCAVRNGRAGKMKGEAENINNFKFLIELSITQFSEFFNLEIIEKLAVFGGKFSLFKNEKVAQQHNGYRATGLTN
ncbi:MAG: hypothetical protein CEN90_553 [Parcubacteria group bacterium Licking1014_17]|nr:MAG: hypothetical protein CEN90_553 [Parcubacteria group bacterium Licking1014_17]